MATKAKQLEEFIDRLGLRHFSGSEFTPYWSRTCTKNGITVRNHVPEEGLWPNIIKTIVLLDELRHRLGAPITMTSTYRSPAYNGWIGGESASYHMKFRAIDFHCSTGTPTEWAAELRRMRGHSIALPDNGGAFEFHGGIGLYRTFVHVDTRGTDANWNG